MDHHGKVYEDAFTRVYEELLKLSIEEPESVIKATEMTHLMEKMLFKENYAKYEKYAEHGLTEEEFNDRYS